MERTVKIYKVGDFTFVEESVNGKKQVYSTDKGRSLEVQPDFVKILPDPEEKVLNNFKIVLSELVDNFGATNTEELHLKLREENFFKKGGGLGSEVLEPFTVRGTSVGKYEDGDVVPEHANNNDRWLDIGRKSIAPIFLAPTLNISGNVAPSSNWEIGQEINISLSSVFTQRDGGVAIGTVYKKDNSNLLNGSNQPINQDTIILTETSVKYKALATYEAGTGEKPDNLVPPNMFPNTIGAGSVESANLSYRGYKPMFFGAVASKPTNSVELRALTKQLINQGNTITLQTGTTHTKFCFWLPTGSSLSNVVHQNINDNLTTSFISESFPIKDIGGVNDITGNLFFYEIGVPFSQSQDFIATKN